MHAVRENASHVEKGAVYCRLNRGASRGYTHIFATDTGLGFLYHIICGLSHAHLSLHVSHVWTACIWTVDSEICSHVLRLGLRRLQVRGVNVANALHLAVASPLGCTPIPRRIIVSSFTSTCLQPRHRGALYRARSPWYFLGRLQTCPETSTLIFMHRTWNDPRPRRQDTAPPNDSSNIASLFQPAEALPHA